MRENKQPASAGRSFAEQLGLHPEINQTEQAITRSSALSQHPEHGIDL
jgi:hypothetical protein